MAHGAARAIDDRFSIPNRDPGYLNPYQFKLLANELHATLQALVALQTLRNDFNPEQSQCMEAAPPAWQRLPLPLAIEQADSCQDLLFLTQIRSLIEHLTQCQQALSQADDRLLALIQTNKRLLQALFSQALRLNANLQKHYAQSYQPPPEGFWQMNHALFTLAEAFQFNNQTILSNYLTLLLFACSDPSRLNRNEIELISNALANFTPFVQLNKQGHHGDPWLIQTDQDRGPICAPLVETLGDGNNYCTLDLSALVQTISENQSPTMQASPFGLTPSQALLQRCQQHWQGFSERQSIRHRLELPLTLLPLTKQTAPFIQGCIKNCSTHGACIEINSEHIDLEPGQRLTLRLAQNEQQELMANIRWVQYFAEQAALKIGVEFYQAKHSPALIAQACQQKLLSF